MDRVVGFRGIDRTPCTVYTWFLAKGATLYAVKGSKTIYATWDLIENYCWIEKLEDFAMVRVRRPIATGEDFIFECYPLI